MHRPARGIPKLPVNAVVGAGLVVWAARVATSPLHDNSFLTHLATGRRILETSSIPRSDPYSYTAANEPWVVQSWLASVLYAWVESMFGGAGLRVAFALLFVLLVVAVWMLTAPARSLVPRLLIAALAVAVGSGAWSYQRPLLFGLLGVAAILLALEGRLPPYVLLPVMWVWVNTHGSFPFAVVLLATVALGRRLDGARVDQEVRLGAFVVGGILLGAVNPLGPRLLVFPLELLQRREVLGFIVEWQPPAFADAWSVAYLVLVMLVLGSLVRQPQWASFVPVAVFLPLSLVAQRNIAIATLVLVPIAARGLVGLGSISGESRSRAATAGTLAFLVLAALVVNSRLAGMPLDLSSYPVAAVAYVDASRSGATQELARVVTPDEVGNLLGYFGAQEMVFMDDRVDMYPRDIILDYVTLQRGAGGWAAIFDRHDVQYVIWEQGGPLDSVLLEVDAWRVVWLDDEFRVFCRRGGSAGC